MGGDAEGWVGSACLRNPSGWIWVAGVDAEQAGLPAERRSTDLLAGDVADGGEAARGGSKDDLHPGSLCPGGGD